MSLLEEGKGMIEAGTGQASYQLDIVKKKLKIYGIQKKIEVEMAKLGEMVYNLFQKKDKDIQRDKQIANLVESIKEQEEEIKRTEQEIADVQSNLQGAKKKMLDTGRDLFKKIKKGLSHHETKGEDTSTKPLEQKRSVIEKEKKEVKEGKKPQKIKTKKP